ncbi:hypothetical protein CL617_05590 [archaeon]|nr:hypothetical protein [archaeon]|tara:strand:- start:2135 stop:2644 length:510 start_codon:yes stop_codon:yes gene_type:complete
MDDINKNKGNQAEKKFKEWLDLHNIPYLYIQQDTKTFSPSLNKYFGSKRPDFMILIPNLGFIFIDIKYRKINETYKSFPLDSIETRKYSVLQRKFNLQIWYVLSNNTYGYKTWFWINVSKVLEEGRNPKFTSGKSSMDFFAIPITDFIQIATNDSLDRLFSKIFVEELK